MLIPDSETVWKTDQEQMKSQLQLYEQEKEEEEEITFIIDTVGDESLQEQDYIAFSKNSENSSTSSSENSDDSL